jgi:flagellar basal-body rod modification protein FlgD
MEQIQASLTQYQAVSYIGKEVTAAGNDLQLKDGQPATCRFELEASAAMTAVSVYDASGGFVNSFETGSLSAGRQTATWNGMDFDGNQMPPGVYEFEVQAVDAVNEKVAVTPLMRALVTGVAFKDNTAHLMTDLQTLAIEDVIGVSEVPSSATAAAAYPTTQPNEQPNGGL